MPRIQPVNGETADEVTTKLLADVKSKMGMVPNLISTMAHSPAVANAYLGISQALSTGTLSGRLREQIALAVGESNQCEYCVSAHTALGKMAGLTEEETVAARSGDVHDDKERAAISLVKAIVRERGFVTDEDINAARGAGYSDGEIGEIVANVAMNIFTNYFNHVAQTEVDFPAAPELAVA